MNKFLVRTISGIVLLIILCSAFAIGGLYLWLLFGAISLIGVTEMFGATKKETEDPWLKYIVYAGTIIYYLSIYFVNNDVISASGLIVVATLLIMMCICVFRYPRYQFSDVTKCFFVYIYVPVLLSFVYLTREGELGAYMVWLIIISSWGCDTCAYVVGSLFGKHKLAPVLSPKKSIEGSIGGSLGSAIIAAIYGYAMNRINGIGTDYIWILAIICFIASLGSQVGDLMASAIKREYAIKDYGKLIPGHGGIMDRFDSMIVTAPLIFILGVLLR